jgi:hypothetical protein
VDGDGDELLEGPGPFKIPLRAFWKPAAGHERVAVAQSKTEAPREPGLALG